MMISEDFWLYLRTLRLWTFLKLSENIWRCMRMSEDIWGCLRISEDVKGHLRMSRDIWGCLGISMDVWWSRRIYKNIWECPRISIIQYYLKISDRQTLNRQYNCLFYTLLEQTSNRHFKTFSIFIGVTPSDRQWKRKILELYNQKKKTFKILETFGTEYNAG